MEHHRRGRRHHCAALVAVSFVTLGGGVWHAFADSMTFTQTVVLEQGGTGWEKIQVGIFGGADVGRRRSRWPMPCRSRWR